MPNLFDLSGKVALITGSSRGIGKAIAERMAEHGAKVVISSRKPGPCEEVRDAINAKHGAGTAIAVPANISSKADLQNLVDETRKAFGKVDIVVVYKIDRLSRSLADFARMVDVFDRHRVSFSAVTQQINSATSMGRLMLNVLLSFAQFEREVTGERIRDKIAASKAKGMWMGGPLPLGYDVRDRLLVINETEAALVRRIFDDFVTVRSATLMAKAYGAQGVVTKGGKPFTKQTIYKMLHNRMYLGEIVHKGQSFPGQH